MSSLPKTQLKTVYDNFNSNHRIKIKGNFPKPTYMTKSVFKRAFEIPDDVFESRMHKLIEMTLALHRYMKNEKSVRFILEGSNIELVLKNINGEILIDTVPLPSLAFISTE
jgi:hypothetical protein